MKWTIKLSREVVQYLVALRSDGEELRTAIEQLRENPFEDSYQTQNDPLTRERFVADHWITYVIEDQDRLWLTITAIEPVESSPSS